MNVGGPLIQHLRELLNLFLLVFYLENFSTCPLPHLVHSVNKNLK